MLDLDNIDDVEIIETEDCQFIYHKGKKVGEWTDIHTFKLIPCELPLPLIIETDRYVSMPTYVLGEKDNNV